MIRHLLSSADLSRDDALLLLDTAEELAAVADTTGKSYTTIEGLGAEKIHPCQKAWLDEDVAQCGFCQPGMIMEAAALLRAHAKPSSAQIEEAMDDHVCRCGTFPRIIDAIRNASRA